MNRIAVVAALSEGGGLVLLGRAAEDMGAEAGGPEQPAEQQEACDRVATEPLPLLSKWSTSARHLPPSSCGASLNPGWDPLYHPHFTDEEPEAQSGLTRILVFLLHCACSRMEPAFSPSLNTININRPPDLANKMTRCPVKFASNKQQMLLSYKNVTNIAQDILILKMSLLFMRNSNLTSILIIYLATLIL